MKKLLTAIAIICSLKSQTQTPALSNFNASQQTQIRAYAKYVNDSTAKVLRAEFNAALFKLSTTPDSTLKVTGGSVGVNPLYMQLMIKSSYDTVNKRIDSNATWTSNVYKYAVSNFRQQTARTDSLVKVLPDMLSINSRISWIESSNREMNINLTDLKEWADRIKLITLQ